MVKETLKEAFDMYEAYLADARHGMAGYDVGKGYEAKNTSIFAQLEILKKHGIETKVDLECALECEGLSLSRLDEISEPYFNLYDDNGNYVSQERNPNYAKPINGITFDNVYALRDWHRRLK